MKKTIFKMLGVIMALCVFLGAMPVAAFAESDEIITVAPVEIIEFSPDTQLEPTVNNTINNFYSDGSQVDTTRYFYNQLTANQKEFYNQILTAGPVEKITIDFSNITITGSTTDEMSSAASQDIMMALTAVNEDNPLHFWASGFGFSYGYYTGTPYKMASMTLTIRLNSTHFSDFNDVATKRDAVIEKLATIKVNGINRHEKVKSIHDYLADNITYDSTLAESNIFDVYGALVNGLCVCEGYAEAFKLICDREGIPCLTVIGTGGGGAHKWNMVQMEDGEWYTLDSTWDDQSSNTYYSYFLIGSDTKAPYFGNSGVADSTVHVPTGKLFSGSSGSLAYPTLSTDTYGVGILRYGAGDVHFDTARGVVMLGKSISSATTYFVSSGDYTRTLSGSGTTGATLTVSDGTTSKSYIVAKRGDVNKTNSVNTTDHTALVNISSAKSTVTDNSAQFYAGDMTQDGAIDGFDAIALELYLNDELIFD